jgi:hypothetical protein
MGDRDSRKPEDLLYSHAAQFGRGGKAVFGYAKFRRLEVLFSRCCTCGESLPIGPAKTTGDLAEMSSNGRVEKVDSQV